MDDYFRDPASAAYPEDRTLRGGHPITGTASPPELTAAPDVFERTAAQGPAAYYWPSARAEPTVGGFDWGDFAIGIGAGGGLLLLLAALGAGLWSARKRTRMRTA